MINEKSKLKESKAHGNPMFPLHVYTNIIDRNTPLFCHWHEEIEIIYIDEGECTLNVDMLPVRVTKGNCYIINSEYLHTSEPSNMNYCKHNAIVFDLNLLSSSIYDYCQSKYIDPLLTKKYKFPLEIKRNSSWGESIINEVKKVIIYCNNKNLGWELNVKVCLLKIIAIIAEEEKFVICEDKALSNKDYKVELLKKCLGYINENFDQKIYIDTLAKEVNMNAQYLCRFFKAFTGKTIIDYINHYRIEEAAKIIQNEECRIIDVCFQVGFDNFSYFIKKFKEYKNCTPSEYKRLIQ